MSRVILALSPFTAGLQFRITIVVAIHAVVVDELGAAIVRRSTEIPTLGCGDSKPPIPNTNPLRARSTQIGARTRSQRYLPGHPFSYEVQTLGRNAWRLG